MMYRTYILLFAVSGGLTAAGFFLEAVPFVLAYLPFGFAILSEDHRVKYVLATGHYIWPAIISAWGLIQLDYSAFYVVPLAILFSISMGWFSALFTVGISAIVLAMIPFIPDNPLLVTGTFLPGFGVIGLFLLAMALTFIEKRCDIRMRGALLSGLMISAVVVPLIIPVGSVQSDPIMRKLDISEAHSITRTGRWGDIDTRIKRGETVALGENIFDHTDTGAISHWCRVARVKEATLFIGVRGPQSVGEVWKFDTTTCPAPNPIYRAQVGIPTVTGGWLPVGGEDGIWGPSPNKPQWIACFEGFSVFRWIGVGLSGTNRAIAISNDKWTEPFPVGRLRRKVGNEFEKLFGIDVFYAETGKSFLIERAVQQ